MICGSGGSKSRLAKAAGAEPAGQMSDEKLHAVVARSKFPSQNVQTHQCRTLLEVEMSKKCTPLWREAHFEVKMYKTPGPDHFWKCDVEKVHPVEARSTFPSQNVQNTPASEPLLEVEMSKKCTPLRREAHFQVKMFKTPHVRATFGGSDVVSLHYTTTLHYTTLHSTTLHYRTLHTLHSSTLHYTTLHYTPLHYTTLHYTTLPSATLHYITLHYTPLQLQLRIHNYTPLH